MTHAEFIDALGGTGAVAKECGVSDAAVSFWKVRESGVSWRFRPLLAELAKEREIELPEGFLGERRNAA